MRKSNAKKLLRQLEQNAWSKTMTRIFSSSKLFKPEDRRRTAIWEENIERQMRYWKYKRKFNNKYTPSDIY